MAHMIQSDRPMDIMLSHDWPAGIWDYGHRDRLLRTKPYFREDMQSGKLGNPPLMHLLMSIKPRFWFSAHLHVKFGATVQHAPYPVPQQQYQHQHQQEEQQAQQLEQSAEHTAHHTNLKSGGRAAGNETDESALYAESTTLNDTEEQDVEGSETGPTELDISDDLQDLINCSKQRIAAQASSAESPAVMTQTTTNLAKPPSSPRSADSAGSAAGSVASAGSSSNLSELGKRSAPTRTPERTVPVPQTDFYSKQGAYEEVHYGVATHFLALDKVLPGRYKTHSPYMPAHFNLIKARRARNISCTLTGTNLVLVYRFTRWYTINHTVL